MLFVCDGVGCVLLNVIVKEVGVMLVMLYYYFSLWDVLVIQLIEECFMLLCNYISCIFVDYLQDLVLVLMMMVEMLGYMVEKNVWFVLLWMQEIIGEMLILCQYMDVCFGEECFQVMLGMVCCWQQEGKINLVLVLELLFIMVISLVLVLFLCIYSDLCLQVVNCQIIVSYVLVLMGYGVGG